MANHKHKEDIDDDKAHAANAIANAKRVSILCTSKSMLRRMVDKEHGVAFLMDDTYEMVLNNCTLRVIGAVDKQHKFF